MRAISAQLPEGQPRLSSFIQRKQNYSIGVLSAQEVIYETQSYLLEPRLAGNI